MGRRLRSLVQLLTLQSGISGNRSQWLEGCRLQRCAARKAARVFLARASAHGLVIATRKAAGGMRAHFVACDSFLLLSCRRIQDFHDRFRISVPQSSDQVRQAMSSTWTWWIKPKRRRGSQVRFLLLPGVRGEWPARQVHVPQVDGGRGRHLPRPLCFSRHERGHPCDVPEGRAMRTGW